MSKKKTLLITGGAGFIGSNFVAYWAKKYKDHKIIVLDALTYAGEKDNIPAWVQKRKGFEFWAGNVCRADIMDHLVGRADVIVHFAAETHVARSIYDNSQFYVTDVLGTQTLANAVLKFRKRIERLVHISTSEVYGTALNKRPMGEEHPLNPKSPYASAKVGADRLVYSYWATYGIPAVIIRPFNNYGPQQHLEKMIPRFVTSALTGEPLTIHGDGSASRDWLYVEDHCFALDKVVHAPGKKVFGQVINLGTGRTISVKQIAEKIVKMAGSGKARFEHLSDRPGNVECHIADISKARELLGWRPKTSFDDGLARTIGWYRANRNWWGKQVAMRHVPIMLENGRTELH